MRAARNAKNTRNDRYFETQAIEKSYRENGIWKIENSTHEKFRMGHFGYV